MGRTQERVELGRIGKLQQTGTDKTDSGWGGPGGQTRGPGGADPGRGRSDPGEGRAGKDRKALTDQRRQGGFGDGVGRSGDGVESKRGGWGGVDLGRAMVR